MSPLAHVIKWLRRLAISLVLIVLVLLALYNSLGRYYAPLLEQYTPWLSQKIRQQTGLQLSFDQLQGRWSKYELRLQFKNLSLAPAAGEASVLDAENLVLIFDPWASLMDLAPRLKSIDASSVSIQLAQRYNGSWGLKGFAQKGKTELKPVVDFIARLDSLDATQLRIQLENNKGLQHQLSAVSLMLRQEQGFRRLLLHASGHMDEKVQLSLETKGDLNLSDLQLKAKLDWQSIELTPWLALFSLDKHVQSSHLNGESWVNLHPDTGLTVQGQLELTDVMLRLPEAQAVDHLGLSSEFKWRSKNPAELQKPGNWQLWLKNTGLAIHSAAKNSEVSADTVKTLQLKQLYIQSESIFLSQHQLIKAFAWHQQGKGILPEYLLPKSEHQQSATGDAINWSVLSDVPTLLKAPVIKTSNWPHDFLTPKELYSINIATPKLALQPWLHHLSSLNSLPKDVVKAIKALNLRGDLKQLQIKLPLNPVYMPAGIRLQAQGENIGSDAWHGSPAFDGAAAFIKTNFFDGEALLLDRAVSFHLPKIFTQAFSVQHITGHLHWQLKPKRIYLMIDSLQVDAGFTKAGLQAELELPFRRKDGEGNIGLLLGLERLSVADKNAILPKVLDQSLLSWLDKSLISGEVQQADLALRASLRSGSVERPHVQLYLQADNTHMQYHSDWPEVSGLDGSLWLYDNQVQVWANQAQLFHSQVQGAKVTLINQRYPSGLASHLELYGGMQGNSVDVLNFMHKTPLHDQLGNFSDNWDLDGQYQVQVDLQVPVTNAKGRLEKQLAVKADLQLQNSLLVLPDLGLQLTDINADLNYQHGRGLRSKNVTAKLWGEPLSGKLDSILQAEKWQVLMDVETKVSVKALQQWSKIPELSFAAGKTAVSGKIDLNADTPNMQLNSQLQGVRVDLPVPFNKPINKAKALWMQIPLTNTKRQWQIKVGDDLNASVYFDQQFYTGGWLRYGKVKQPQPAEHEFVVSAQLQEFDADAWFKALERYQLLTSHQIKKPQAPDVKVRVENLFAEQLFALGYDFDYVTIRAQQLQKNWQINVLDNVFSGVFVMHEDDTPLKIELQHLDTSLLALAADNQEQGRSTMDPRDLLAADVEIHDLHEGKESWGSWEFKVRPSANGARISDIFASVKASEVEGTDSQAGGAEVDWQYHDGKHQTRFIGKITTGNFARVLAAWEYESFMESEEGRVVADLSWAGTPLDFEMEKVHGSANFHLGKGLFKETSTAASNTLKVVGILNLDNLVRRLQLDFSDIGGGKGLAFDSIHGELEFDEGQLLFAKPIILKGSASDMTFTGKADLLSKTIDAELGMTLAISSNFSWVAYLASGFSAAIGIYVISKLLKDQVDKLTSAVYSISGDWNDPELKFQRLFDNSP